MEFLFLAGTTMLTQSYRPSEGFAVQAVNDFLVFGLQAVGSLGAGVLLAVTAGMASYSSAYPGYWFLICILLWSIKQ